MAPILRHAPSILRRQFLWPSASSHPQRLRCPHPRPARKQAEPYGQQRKAQERSSYSCPRLIDKGLPGQHGLEAHLESDGSWGFTSAGAGTDQPEEAGISAGSKVGWEDLM